MFTDLINIIVEFVSSFGYLGIVIMMFLESSFFPFPSEVVMIPAGYLAYKGEMNLAVVITCGILGSILGAIFNYYLAKTLGRKFVIKYGKYIFFSPENMEKVELFFKKHGHISTFSGRLVPVIRQYISLPAGLANMNLIVFSIYTALGAGLWVTILSLLGFFIGENELLVKEYLNNSLMLVLVFVVAVVMFYVFYNKKRKI